LSDSTYRLQPVGWVESPLTDRASAPKQSDERAPLARVVFRPEFCEAARDLKEGDEVLLLTWLHRGRRDVLFVHPRGDMDRSRRGVFATRSPDCPNPIGLHAVVIEAVEENSITIHNLEAIDGTPVLDIKPILGPMHQR
jgi:tRNA-Thr(GGU) m(6)t(6)A37 methyltransferase TsaA